MKPRYSLAFIVSLPLLFAACSTIHEMERFTSVRALDFRPYADKGFLFTPNRYTLEYDSRGIVTIEVWPKVVKIPREKEGKMRSNPETFWQDGWLWIAEEVPTQDALDSAYAVATRLGADALVEFESERIEVPPGSKRTVMRMNGFAIKRQSLKVAQ